MEQENVLDKAFPCLNFLNGLVTLYFDENVAGSAGTRVRKIPLSTREIYISTIIKACEKQQYWKYLVRDNCVIELKANSLNYTNIDKYVESLVSICELAKKLHYTVKSRVIPYSTCNVGWNDEHGGVIAIRTDGLHVSKISTRYMSDDVHGDMEFYPF